MRYKLRLLNIYILSMFLFFAARTVCAADVDALSSKIQPEAGKRPDAASLLEIRAEKGLKNLEPYSIALTSLGLKKLDENKDNEATAFMIEAGQLSPDLPLPYLYLAKINFSFSPDGFSRTAGYLMEAWRAFNNNFVWSFMTAEIISLSLLLSFYVSVIVFVLVLISSKLRIFMHDIAEDKTKALLLLPAVILAFFGPVFGVLGLLIPYWVYIKDKERIMIYGIMCATIIVFSLIRFFAMFPGAWQDKALLSVVKVNEGIYSGEMPHTAKASDNFEISFSGAVSLKRKGDCDEAIEIYRKLLDKRKDARVQNNIANCYVALNNLDEALKYYGYALESQQTAAAYYNVSQIYRENFDFNNANEYYLKATEADPRKVASYEMMRGTSLNRFVMDETLTFKELWALAFKRSHSYPLSALLGIFSSVNRWIGILLLFLLAGSLYIYDKTVSFYAFMCKRCGKIYCSKCEKKVTYDQLCHSCFQALVSLGELTPEERVERILEIQRYKSRRIRRLKVLTLFLPGSGHVYYGWSGYGFLILMAFTFFLFSSLLWFRLSVPESMNPVASMFGWISACGFILIYVITAMRILRRVS